MQNPTTITAPTFEDTLTTLCTTKTLLLLTIGSEFDKTTIDVAYDSAKSSTAHTKKLHS